MSDIFSLLFLVLLLFSPSSGRTAALQALEIWGLQLVPSLFPYMVLCQTLTQAMTRSTKIPPLLPFAIGLLGGSPSASASLSVIAARRPMKRKTKLFLCSLAGTISPMFFLGLAAAWFSSVTTAWFLLLSQYVGALIAGFLFFLFSSNNDQQSCRPLLEQENIHIVDPLTQSVRAVLNVGGCIVFYSTAAACIQPLFSFLPDGIAQCMHALLEISGGLHALSLFSIDHGLKLVFSAGLSGFGGLSILNQNLLFLRSIGIDKKDLLLLSAFRGIFSMAAMAVLLIL